MTKFSFSVKIEKSDYYKKILRNSSCHLVFVSIFDLLTQMIHT